MEMTLKSTRDKEILKLEREYSYLHLFYEASGKKFQCCLCPISEGVEVYLMCNRLPNAGFIAVVLFHCLLYECSGSLRFLPTFVFHQIFKLF